MRSRPTQSLRTVVTALIAATALSGTEVERLVRTTENLLRRESPVIARGDVVPWGQ